MKYVFFGTPEFAAIILEKLIAAGLPPAAVVCNPDRPVGRKQVITPPPVKTRIMNYESGIKEKIQILQPEKLDKNFLNSLFLIHNSFDLFIVAAYAKILPKEIIDLPRLGTIGVHPSLLPKYRGATPIQNAILNGETETGVTLFLIDEKVDHGPILAQQELAISNSQFPISKLTYAQLLNKLAELGADLLVKTLPSFIKGNIKPRPQNEAEATYTKKFTTEDGYVDLEKDDPKIVWLKIRALNPEPGVYTIKNGKRIKLLEAEFKEGKLEIKKIQIEGKKPTSSLEPLLS